MKAASSVAVNEIAAVNCARKPNLSTVWFILSARARAESIGAILGASEYRPLIFFTREVRRNFFIADSRIRAMMQSSHSRKQLNSVENSAINSPGSSAHIV